jgi:hypothetical protein
MQHEFISLPCVPSRADVVQKIDMIRGGENRNDLPRLKTGVSYGDGRQSAVGSWIIETTF